MPVYFDTFDSVARAADLSVLRGSEGEDPEIRVWHDRGIMPPHTLLQLRETRIGWVGQFLVWWPLLPDDAAWSAHVDLEVRERYRCARVVDAEGLRLCSVLSPDRDSWPALAARLAGLRLEALPDESQLDPPDDRMIVDGETLVVEVRRGTRYRAYHYYVPRAREWAEAIEAAGILDVMNSLLAQAEQR
jgi:hypothetical protein